MKKRIISLALVLVMMFSLASPLFAVSGVVHPDFNRDKLREVVVSQTTSVTGLIAGLLPADTIKGLVKDAVSGMLNLDDIGNLAGGALGGLLESAIKDSLGIELPGSIDLGGIINDVLSNEFVNSILTSDFVNKVIDRTIDNLIDSLVIEDVIGVLAESVVDQLTDEIWNGGNPSSSSYTIPFFGTVVQTGHWNTTGGWNSTNIGLTIAAKLGISGLTGGIGDYVDVSKIDFTKLFSVDTILNALIKAVTDTATEYFDALKPVVISMIQEQINALKDKAKAELISDLNRIFELKLSALESLESLEAKIIAHLRDSEDYVEANKDKILEDLKELKEIVNQLDKYSCLDLSKVNCLLDKLIKCLEGEVEPPIEPPIEPPVEPELVSADPFAVVEKVVGNTNKLTITIIGTYSDGSSALIAEKTFVISNNAIGTYEVGDYNVYVDTKGNTQIRACYIV